MTATVRALSVRQPWAALIVDGVKDVENRTWSTPHRGPLAIHAARTPVEVIASRSPLEHYTFGAVIGVVDLVDVVRNHPSEWSIDGCYHWLLARPRRLRGGPVTVRGRLGLFPVELDEL